MAVAFLALLFCQLVGELVREALHLPIPGPVIGMFLLAGLFGSTILSVAVTGLVMHWTMPFAQSHKCASPGFGTNHIPE